MASTPQKPKPSVATAILVPLFIWIVTSIIGGVLIAMGIAAIPDAVEDLDRAPVGQETMLDLDAGDYRVFLEGNGVSDSFANPTGSVTITGPDGEPVSVSAYDSSTSLTYDFSGNEGTAAFTFEASSSGSYTVLVESSDPAVDGVALGTQNPLTAGGVTIAIGVVVGTVGFLVALIVMIVLLVRRSRSKKRAFQAANAGYGYGAPPQGPWGAGQQ